MRVIKETVSQVQRLMDEWDEEKIKKLELTRIN